MTHFTEVVEINSSEIRIKLRDVLEDVAFKNKVFAVLMHGKLRAYVVPAALGEQLLQGDSSGTGS